MSWNYRIVRTQETKDADVQYGLYEVYYHDKEPWARTYEAIIIGDTVHEIISALITMLKDAQDRPVLNDEDITGNAPWDREC